LNAFNPSFVQCYEMPKRTRECSESFLTDTHDFFCVSETLDDEFEICRIDLDDPNPRLRSLFRYSFDEVGGQAVQAFHCRGSSHKEKINLNEMLVVYLLHGTDLYYWVQGNEKLQLVEHDATNLYYMSDNVLFYQHDPPVIRCSHNSNPVASHVMILETMFGGCRTREVYKDMDPKAEVLNFGVDNTRKRLIILTGVKNMKNRRDKFLTIFDIDAEQVIYSTKITDKEIIGRLKSNLYNFTEGHIYYGNSVVKIRYDLIEMNAKDGKPIYENQLFDTYHNVLPLDDNAIVQSGTPM
jgi:hypothetical protein